MTTDESNILTYHQVQRSMKLAFLIYVNFENLLEKRDAYYKFLKSTEINKHAACRFSIFVKYANDKSEHNKFLLCWIRLHRNFFEKF